MIERIREIMKYQNSDSIWDDIGEKAEFYMRQYPRDLEASLITLQDIHPNLSIKELYKIVIKSHANLIGITSDERDDYAEDVLHQVEMICAAQSTPFCFRSIVSHLIGQLFIGTVQASVSEIISEDL